MGREKSIRKLAEELGIVSESLRRWIRQLEIDTAKREGLTTEEHEELRGLLPSMEQVGSAYDRSLAESFVATLNTELLYRPCWSTHQMACIAIFEYIKGYYNTKRRYSALGYLSLQTSRRIHYEDEEKTMLRDPNVSIFPREVHS